jgi:hypothetical protein
MIALPQRLPHVIWKNDRLVPLSEGWLAESIEHAAEAAGHHRWHLAPEVARAIAVYLENDWVAPALRVDHLCEMVQRSLEGIGYDDIAGKPASCRRAFPSPCEKSRRWCPTRLASIRS